MPKTRWSDSAETLWTCFICVTAHEKGKNRMSLNVGTCNQEDFLCSCFVWVGYLCLFLQPPSPASLWAVLRCKIAKLRFIDDHFCPSWGLLFSWCLELKVRVEKIKEDAISSWSCVRENLCEIQENYISIICIWTDLQVKTLRNPGFLLYSRAWFGQFLLLQYAGISELN